MKYIGLTIGLTLAVVASTVAAEGVVRVIVDDQYIVDDEDNVLVFTTIQAAIDICPDGGTVEIEPGFYFENIYFSGMEATAPKAITVTGTDPEDPEVVAATVVQSPNEWGNVFTFNANEGPDSVLQGLTITGGFNLYGGGILCQNGSPLIRRCVIVGNQSFQVGGGLYCATAFASPIVENCTFSENIVLSSTEGYGGAVYVEGGSPEFHDCLFENNNALHGGALVFWNSAEPLIENCTMMNNLANGEGGAVYVEGGSPVIRNSLIVGNYAQFGGAFAFFNTAEPRIENCTVADNVAIDLASAVYCEGETFLTVENTIFWGNLTNYQDENNTVIYATDQTEGWIDYCCIQGGQENVDVTVSITINMGQGTIFEDPQFVLDGDYSSGLFLIGDYHLQETSPCINAGNPDFAAYDGEVDLDGEARVAGGRIDIGMDEVPMSIEADVVFVPRKVYVNLPGKYIYAYIRLEHEQYTIHEIDKKTIVLNDTIKPKHVYTLDNALLVQFKRDDLLKKKAIQSMALLQLTIRGQMNDGAAWSGTGEIQLEKFYWKKWFHGWKWKWFR